MGVGLGSTGSMGVWGSYYWSAAISLKSCIFPPRSANDVPPQRSELCGKFLVSWRREKKVVKGKVAFKKTTKQYMICVCIRFYTYDITYDMYTYIYIYLYTHIFLLYRQFIATIPAGWSTPFLVVNSKGIRTPKWSLNIQVSRRWVTI